MHPSRRRARLFLVVAFFSFAGVGLSVYMRWPSGFPGFSAILAQLADAEIRNHIVTHAILSVAVPAVLVVIVAVALWIARHRL